MQDLGWRRRWGSRPAARRGARQRAGLTPASASNTLSCLLEMLHSKQLSSSKCWLTVITVSTATISQVPGFWRYCSPCIGSHKMSKLLRVPPGKRRHASTRSRDRRTRPIELFDDTCLIIQVLSEAKGLAVQRGRQTPCRPSRPSGRCRPGTVSLCVGHRAAVSQPKD